ncbi:MAG TPA: MarR family transcriptional regulator [Sedimentisphaerales bacterium]|nr:MarR family transcriptional regulator [Sedimentisphaerales bacterium]
MSRQLFELILAVRRKCQGNEGRIQRELGLSPAEFNALIVMVDGGEITGCEFADRMSLSFSRASRVLSKLVADGYLRTRPSPQDRRTIRASLTPKGKRTRQRMFEHMEVCESRICRGLDPEKLMQVRNALELLEAAL